MSPGPTAPGPAGARAVAIGADAIGVRGPAERRSPAPEPTVRVRHNRVELGLHLLRAERGTGAGADRPLLLLHGLGERTQATPPAASGAWPGPVWGLDFTGHGWSTIPRGGGYTAELLMADADAALAHLGPATVWGRGLGAYVALLLAGGRPRHVRGAVLTDGPGMVGGGIGPGGPRLTVPPARAGVPDPYALAELTVDVRPPDYAASYLEQARLYSDLPEPVSLCGVVRPPWMAALDGEPGVWVGPVADALARYAATS